jgi:hypothetical protein
MTPFAIWCRVPIISHRISKRRNLFTFSFKDRYQLNYFICIKDMNTETNTSLKLDLFSFFICCCIMKRKRFCLYIFQSYKNVYISNIARKTHFWNNLHQVCSSSKNWKLNHFIIFWEQDN